jgi:hypothetical protein
MGKVSYANLKLKVDNSIKTFDFNGQTIEVLKYLSTEDKYDLIMITLQKAEENGIYNPLKLDVYFNLHLVYMYTNLSFTDKQKEDELKIYDTLKSNGFFELFLDTIEEDEYNFLFNMISELVSYDLNYRNTAGAVLQSVINDLPRNAQVAADIINSFDATKYQAVVDFAQAANGGRPINDNGNIVPISTKTE